MSAPNDTVRPQLFGNGTQYFLGINCAHDAAACIVSDDGIQVAVREERLNRKKHYEGFPKRAIRYCLDTLGVESFQQIAGATINQYPKMDCQFELMDMGYSGPIHINPSHHLLHAYYARYFAAGRNCLIVVADGSGYNYGEYKRNGSPMLGSSTADSDADEAETVFAVRDGCLILVHKRWGVWEASTPYFRFPSLGHSYGVASQHIFKSVSGWLYAGKVMGLAPYGSIEAGIPPMVSYTRGGFEFDLDWFRRLPQVDDNPEYWKDPNRCNIAARAQHDLETTLIAWLRDLAQSGATSIVCLTGGVAHNSVANGRLVAVGSFHEYLFPPAADDAGTAIGGALYGFEAALGRSPKAGFRTEFHGRSYSTEEVDRIVGRDSRVRVTDLETVESLVADAAGQLSNGRFIAVYDGGSEFSARALGHRSILCDPRLQTAKQYLNGLVKFREEFRPYAVMILDKCAEEYFELKVQSPYMMVVANIRDDKKEEIPAVCHVDGTCRIQTVGSDYEGIAAAILRAFHAKTGLPMLLNTSFNIRGEPIVETPDEALECFCTTGLDALYIYPYRIEKHPLSWDLSDPVFLTYVPVVSRNIVLESKRDGTNSGWSAFRYVLRSKTGHERLLTRNEYEVLSRINGRRSIAELTNSGKGRDRFLRTLKRLTEIGAVALAHASDTSYMAHR